MNALARLLLLELRYDLTYRPVDLGASSDTRALALGLFKIEVSCSDSGRSLGVFDFRARNGPRTRALYGLSDPEDWGTWSLGARTGLVLELKEPPTANIRISIDHKTLNAACSPIGVRFYVNSISIGHFFLPGGRFSVEVALVNPLLQALPSSIVGSIAPKLSIIVLNYARDDLVFACLTYILAAAITAPYEIILVNNGSQIDANSVGLRGNARVVNLPNPCSFGTANNLGAEAATGEFLLFLNNDAFLEEGVVEKLIDAFSEPDVGAAGPIYRYPDGTIQEVGRFVSADGTTNSSIYNGFLWDSQQTDVDYISAACLLLRRADFLSIGGFDPQFRLAYHEDVDLCLRLKALGRKTRLVPTACVAHVRGATSDQTDHRDISEKARARNLLVFRSRWGRWLATRQASDVPFDIGLYSNMSERQDARSDGGAVHCVFGVSDLQEHEAWTESLSVADALAELRPTAIAIEEHGSSLDAQCAQLSSGLPDGRLTCLRSDDLHGDRIDVAVFSTFDFPSFVPRVGQYRILHCPFPKWLNLRGDDEAAFGTLANFDAIVTESKFAHRAWLQALNDAGYSQVPVQVIGTGIDLETDPPDAERENIVVSVGPIKPEEKGGCHAAVLRAFRRLTMDVPGTWRLVIVGPMGLEDEPRYAESLQASGQPWDVDILVDPPRKVLRRLLARSKVYVSAHGLVADASGDTVPAYSHVRVADAVFQGCVPVVLAGNAESEFCEDQGVGFAFGNETGLLHALKAAALSAGSNGLPPEIRARMKAFSRRAQRENWASLVSSIVGPNDSRGGVIDASDDATAAIVVVGSHRSGTSAIARALSLCGMDLPQDLMSPQPDNPRGFWESAGISDWNEAILRAAGTAWDDGFAFFKREDLSEAVRERFVEALSLVRERFDHGRPIVLKDPRISLMSRPWHDVLEEAGFSPRYVVMLRDPREVSASLAFRNGYSSGKAMLIWASHMLATETDTRDRSRVFVSYSDLLASPADVLDHIGSKLGVGFPRRRSATPDVLKFIEPELRHHSATKLRTELDTKAIDDYYQTLLYHSDDIERLACAGERLTSWLAETRNFISSWS